MFDEQRRVESGIPRLDYILKGGFFRGGTYVVMGPPGSGKTIFANQICFNLAADGGSCVYVTLLVESHAKMLAHLSSLRFYDASKIPESIYYVSAYPALKSGGFDAVLSLVRRTIRERKATFLVIDGMESLDHFAKSPQEIREVVHELQSLATMHQCTTLLLSIAREAHIENALVDGVLELSDNLVGPRAVRELTVHKFRGGDYLRGRHEVEIQAAGLVVHPRTEIQFDKPPEQATEKRIRMPFGVVELDKMLDGGIPSGSTTALLGAPGTGKTLLGLAFLLEGARHGQHGTYVGFYEPPPRLIEKAKSVGMDLEPYCDKGLLSLRWQPPLEHMMDSLAEKILEDVRGEKMARRRMFIDGAEGFRAAAVYADRVPRFLSALANQLRTLDVTALISDELPLFTPEVSMSTPELGNVVESVILLRYVELRSQIHRLLSILKMRESAYDTSIREFQIGDQGVEVASSFESAESVLTGVARSIAERESRRARKPSKKSPKKAARRGGRR